VREATASGGRTKGETKLCTTDVPEDGRVSIGFDDREALHGTRLEDLLYKFQVTIESSCKRYERPDRRRGWET
jgi:hypothetical protein